MSRTPATMIGGTTLVPFAGTLFDGRSVSVGADGSVRITTMRAKKPLRTQRQTLTGTQRLGFRPGASAFDRERALFELAKPLPAAYAPHSVIVVFKDGTTIATDHAVVPDTTLRAMRAGARSTRAATAAVAPRYTTDDRLNALFAKLAVSRTDRLFAGVPRGTLAQYASRAASRSRSSVLNLGNAFRLTITNARLPAALRELAKMPNVAYAGHDFFAGSMSVAGTSVPSAKLQEARDLHPRRAFGRSAANGGRGTLSVNGSAALDNFTVTSSGQAFLNASGVDAIAAFDEIAQNFSGQLPGTGVTITNVSLGDLDDASALANSADPCNALVARFGPTSRMIGGQRYLDLPSLPLIPAYVASRSGALSGSAETCGVDPFLQEIALDFAVMAPLPHALQRPGEAGDGLTDLLGVAPGASYRLVVPAVNDTSSLFGAVLGAATQSPAPDVITMSVGWGLDKFGFPSRYFEDDALARSVVSTVTNSFNIPMFIAANDGTRAGLWAPIGPSGGSAPTNVAAPGAPFTTLDDVGLTTGASVIPDTGAIDVGGTTLDDVASANPQDPANAALASTHAFPETRFNGFAAFSSGFGSRVNVAAPADNILTFVRFGARYDSTVVDINGGTSASAPIAAAVAAVAIQVAKLTGHPFTSVAALRTFLAQTGTPVAQSRVTDAALNVGPQVSARRAVEALLAAGHVVTAPSVGRVAIMQRKTGCTEYGACFPDVALEYTDPGIISLRLPQLDDGTYTGARTTDYITIAPDWENLPANAQFRLTVTGKPNAVLASGPFVRLLPAQIFAAAGQPLASTAVRTISLTYQSTVGLHVVAQTTFDLRFGPADGTSTALLAPVIPPVVAGATVPVAYDTSLLPAGFGGVYFTIWLNDRFDGFTHIVYKQSLAPGRGTVSVPVSALNGDGVYFADLWYGGPDPQRHPRIIGPSAYFRISGSGTARPPAPLLGTAGSPPAHSLEVPYAQPITVGWDVSNVPGATAATVEVSFGAPSVIGNFNVLNNPNGGALDTGSRFNGITGRDTGAIYHQTLNGVSGTVTIDPRALKVLPGVFHSIRILPVNGTTVVGEASDTSAFAMDGVAPPDGGTVFAHGLNTSAKATDGLLTSIQEGCISGAIPQYNYYAGEGTGTGTTSAAMTFDQKTLQITNPALLASTSCDSQPMVFAGDTGLLYDRDAHAFVVIPGLSSPAPSFQYLVMPPGAVPNDFANAGTTFPPFSQAEFFQGTQEYVGGSASSGVASFFGLNGFGSSVPGHGTAFSLNLGTLAPTPVMTIDDFMTFGFPAVLGATYDPTTNTGYYAVSDALDYGSTAVSILAIDYAANTHTVFSASGLGPAPGEQGISMLAIDPGTQKLLYLNDLSSPGGPTDLHIIDLKTHTVSIVAPPQYAPTTSTDVALVDPINHLFIVVESRRTLDQDDLTLPSGVDFFDESGNLVKHVAIPYTFFPYVGGVGPGQELTFANGNLRRLFIGAPPNPAGIFEPQLMTIDY